MAVRDLEPGAQATAGTARDRWAGGSLGKVRRTPLPRALAEQARRQAGCLSRDQLRWYGLDADHVARRVRSGSWQTAGPAVVVLHSGPLGQAELRWAAVLTSAPRSALAAWTALEVHGLIG